MFFYNAVIQAENKLRNILSRSNSVVAVFFLVGALMIACGGTTPEPKVEQAEGQTQAQSPMPEPRPNDAQSTSIQSPTVPPQETPKPSPTRVSTPEPTWTPLPRATLPTHTPVPASATEVPTPEASLVAEAENEDGVLPDSDFERAMSAARLNARGWDTDFRLHTVP